MRFVQVDEDEARFHHSLAFAGDVWCREATHFWLAYEGKKVIGFLALRMEDEAVYVSRIATVKAAEGRGIARKLIKRGLRYAKDYGARYAHTYTLLRNYESMCMLLKCGFRFVPVPKGFRYTAPSRVHYFARSL